MEPAVKSEALYYVTVREFTFAGVVFSAGDEFPPSVMDVTERRLKLLCEARKLKLGHPARMWEDRPENAVEDPEPGPRLVHTGGGWYNVHVGHGRTERAHGRAAAEALLAEADSANKPAVVE